MRDEPTEGFALGSIGRSAAILTAATMVVQLVGIVRELFLAAEVGVSSQLDAVIIGIALPMMLAAVFTAGGQTALVPTYMGTRDSTGMDDARRVAGTVLVWAAILGALASLGLVLLADPLISLTGPGLSTADAASAAGYLRTVAPVAFLTGVSAVLLAVCQGEKLFRVIAAWSIVSPTVALGVMLVLWDRYALDAVAIGALAGPVVGVAFLLIVVIRRGIVPRPHLVTRGLGLATFARHATPLTISQAILQLNWILDRAIATIIAPGAVSVLRFGDSLLRAPIGAIRPAWSGALYPSLVPAAARTGAAGLGPSTETAYRYTIAVFVPLAVLSAAAAPVATAVVYGRGAFDAEDIASVSRVLVAFAPLVFLLTMDAVTTPALNARRRGMALLAAGTMNVILNLVFDIVFGLAFGVVGIALSSTITAAVVTVWKMHRFARGEAGIDLRRVWRSMLLALLASSPGGFLFGILAWNVDLQGDAIAGLAFLAVAGTLGLASYVLIAPLIGLHEPGRMSRAALRWLRRR